MIAERNLLTSWDVHIRRWLIPPEGTSAMPRRFTTLSTDDVETLHLIDHGGVHSKSLSEEELNRLKHLGLVDEGRVGLTLSTAGQQCLNGGEPHQLLRGLGRIPQTAARVPSNRACSP